MRSLLGETCRLAVAVTIAALVLHTWLVMGLVVPVTVSGSSMEPTLQPAQRLIVDRTAFLFRPPRRWEIVVFRCPEAADRLCVKRVVGLPGESISFAGGHVLINGRPVRPPSGRRYELRYGDHIHNPSGWRLGADDYFVLGDNGTISDDSRNWLTGPGLDGKLLLGRPMGVR